MKPHEIIELVLTTVADHYQKDWKGILLYPMTVYALSELMAMFLVADLLDIEQKHIRVFIAMWHDSVGKDEHNASVVNGILSTVRESRTIQAA